MRLVRTLVAILSLIPILIPIAFATACFAFLARAWRWLPDSSGAGLWQVAIATVFVATALAIPTAVGYMVFVGVSNLSAEKKVIWLAALIMANAVAVPFAWFFLVQREQGLTRRPS